MPALRIFALSLLVLASSDSGHNDTDESSRHNATATALKPYTARLLQSRAGGEALEAWDERPLLFLGVCSCANDAARRREIRDTYWQDPALVGGLLEARFVVGQPRRGSAVEEQLREEVLSRPQDFLRLAVPDGDDRLDAPRNRTAKTVALLAWFSRYSRARYLLKMEDDALPHFAALVPRLLAETDPLVQLGALVPCRERLSSDAGIWDHDHYPKYMDGGAYILSSDLARTLDTSRAFEQRRHLSLEDATVGLWLELDRQAHPDFNVSLKVMNMTIGGCSAGDLVSTNNAPGHMTCAWRRQMKGEADVCCPQFAAEAGTSPTSSLLQTGASMFATSTARGGQHTEGLRLRLVQRHAVTGDANATSANQVNATKSKCYPGSIGN